MPKILLADDMTNFLDLEISFLRRADCEIVTAQDGAQALKLAKLEKPDVILLDVEMPRMTGIEACRILKKDPTTKNIPVIIVTATSRKDEAEKAGCDDFWQKPISEMTFMAGLKRFVEIVEREDRRVAIGIQVDYKVGEGQTKVVHAFTRDLSSGGMFIITRDTLPVGDTVDLEFVLPGSPDKINVSGTVVRSFQDEERGHYIGGMGLTFSNVSDDVNDRLIQFIQESTTI